MSIKKPKLALESLEESVQVFFYSAYAILYYTWVWLKKNFHRFIHLVWMFGFAGVYCSTLNVVWMWIGIVPAIIYAILWTVWLRKILNASSC